MAAKIPPPFSLLSQALASRDDMVQVRRNQETESRRRFTIAPIHDGAGLRWRPFTWAPVRGGFESQRQRKKAATSNINDGGAWRQQRPTFDHHLGDETFGAAGGVMRPALRGRGASGEEQQEEEEHPYTISLTGLCPSVTCHRFIQPRGGPVIGSSSWSSSSSSWSSSSSSLSCLVTALALIY